MERDRNLVLIGMPGVGKSTLGVLLAKATGRDFLDTDVYLQSRQRRSLQDIIDDDGTAVFRQLEEDVVCSLACRGTVIATGGSVVYSRAAMTHLRSAGFTVYLFLPLPELQTRLDNFGERGVVRAPGQTLESLFAERAPLYRLYSDLVVDCSGQSHEPIVSRILALLP